MKLGIIWSRDIQEYDLSKHITKYKWMFGECYEIVNHWRVETIISWWATGIDTIAKQFAIDNNIAYIEHNPYDDKYGHLKNKKKPLARNEDIVNNSTLILAIWDWKSHWTKWTIDYAKSVGKDVILINI